MEYRLAIDSARHATSVRRFRDYRCDGDGQPGDCDDNVAVGSRLRCLGRWSSTQAVYSKLVQTGDDIIAALIVHNRRGIGAGHARRATIFDLGRTLAQSFGGCALLQDFRRYASIML